LNLEIHRRRQSRARFLRRLALLGAVLVEGIGQGAEGAVSPGAFPKRQSRPNSKIKRWDVITLGNLSRNRYWGESDARGLRAAICTCTVIQGEGFRLLVDPSLSGAEDMARELERRTGLKPGDINQVFITHEHGDHYAGLAHFPQARWLGGSEVARILNESGKLPKKLEPVTGKLFDEIEIVPTPGHTMSLCSLRFDWEGLSVAVVGDAVATRDFWRERRGYYNCVDFELSARSMDKLARMADVIVPGHDNYFLVH
jgi:glyoxylase-like metal-dependent hydrolase (beta-lactamase superfamily II)